MKIISKINLKNPISFTSAFDEKEKFKIKM